VSIFETEPKHSNKGFTLLEVLGVSFIASLLITAGINSISVAINNAKVHTTKVEMANISSGLKEYYKDTGMLPSEISGLKALTEDRDELGELWRGPYISGGTESFALDSFNRAYIYKKFKDPTLGIKAIILSKGKDGLTDLKNYNMFDFKVSKLENNVAFPWNKDGDDIIENIILKPGKDDTTAMDNTLLTLENAANSIIEGTLQKKSKTVSLSDGENFVFPFTDQWGMGIKFYPCMASGDLFNNRTGFVYSYGANENKDISFTKVCEDIVSGKTTNSSDPEIYATLKNKNESTIDTSYISDDIWLKIDNPNNEIIFNLMTDPDGNIDDRVFGICYNGKNITIPALSLWDYLDKGGYVGECIDESGDSSDTSKAGNDDNGTSDKDIQDTVSVCHNKDFDKTKDSEDKDFDKTKDSEDKDFDKTKDSEDKDSDKAKDSEDKDFDKGKDIEINETIHISPDDLAEHIGHGDTIGECK